MTKKTKIIATMAAAASVIGAATVGLIAFGKSRARKIYAQLMEDMKSCGFGEEAEDEATASYDELKFRSFTYWIPIPDKGRTYEENLKTLITTFMKTNGIVSLVKDPITIVIGRRFYIKSLSPDMSKKSAGEIIGLLDSFYKRFCSKSVYESDDESYRSMRAELRDDIEDGCDICIPTKPFSYSFEKSSRSDIKQSYAIVTLTVPDKTKLVEYLIDHLRILDLDLSVSIYNDIDDVVILTYEDRCLSYMVNPVVMASLTTTDVIQLLYQNFIETEYTEYFYSETDESKFELMNEAFLNFDSVLTDDIIKMINSILDNSIVGDTKVTDEDMYDKSDVYENRGTEGLVNLSLTKLVKHFACLRQFIITLEDDALFRESIHDKAAIEYVNSKYSEYEVEDENDEDDDFNEYGDEF